MADVQAYFERFHDAIRIDYDHSKLLREKRDIVLGRIKTHLAKSELPTCDELLQGSYRMKTGVQPIDELEFDIDIGLRFDILETDYRASDVRAWIWNAVEEHTQRVEDKTSCIRVCYERGFHLDLVTYACWESDGKSHYRLADKDNGWRQADPPGLLEYVNNYRKAFVGTEDSASKTDQFRRCVRYMKRWGDERITVDANEKPSGLAFVLLAVQQSLPPSLTWEGYPDDRAALQSWLTTMCNILGRVQANKPTPEYEDVLSRLTQAQMDTLKRDLAELLSAIRFSEDTTDPVAACKRLHQHFGRDFPIPDPKEGAKKTSAPAIITSSRSA